MDPLGSVEFPQHKTVGWGVHLYWFAGAVVSFGLLFLLIYVYFLPVSVIKRMAVVLLILTPLFLVFSGYLQQGRHKWWREPLCFIGRWEVAGKSNFSGYLAFICEGICFTFFSYLVGNLVVQIRPGYFAGFIVAWSLGLSGLGMTIFSLIPIDIHRRIHLVFAFVWTISFSFGSAFVFAYIITSGPRFAGYQIFVYLQFLTILTYWIAYIRHHRASFFQKFAYFAMVFAMFGYIQYFAQFLD
jgi:hypothetical protein